MAQDSNAGLRDRLAQRPAVPIPLRQASTDHALISVPCLLVGWSLRESSGSAAAAVELYSGGSTGGVLAGEQQLATSASNTVLAPYEGVLCEGGVFVHFVTGQMAGCLYVRN